MLNRSIQIIAVISLLTACSSNEIGNSKDVNPDTIFTRYSVSGREGDENAECFAQFRFAGENGTTLVLNDPAKILLDGNVMRLDSSDVSGAYYTHYASQPSFTGKHSFRFVNTDGKTFEEIFEFNPFFLKQEIPRFIQKNKALLISIQGLADGERLRLTISDSASATNDIDKIDTVRNGTIIALASELQELSNGPLRISIQKTDSHPLQQSTSEGGDFEMNYSLKNRESILEDYEIADH